MTTLRVIKLTRKAFNTSEFEKVKDRFETANERGCPLD